MMRLDVVCVPLSTRLARTRRFGAGREALAEALAASGARAGAPRALPHDAWPRTQEGAPATVRGWHASFADTTGLVVALVAPQPAALDAEWALRPRWQAARARFQESGELARLGGDGRDEVLALWTAKEALLKLARTGLADLARCPLVRRAGARFWLRHAGREHAVEVRRAGAHWIACASHVPATLELHELVEVP